MYNITTSADLPPQREKSRPINLLQRVDPQNIMPAELTAQLGSAGNTQKDNDMTNQYDVYDAEAELLDAYCVAILNERAFYLQKELDDLKDQTRLLDHITLEAQADYFAEPVSNDEYNADYKERADLYTMGMGG